MNLPKTSPVCVLCGVKPATTADHVPPKSVFAKPRPSNLVTVPACETCNKGGSVDDEEFGAFVATVATSTSDRYDPALFNQRVTKPLHHNNRLYRQVVEQAQRVTLATPSGFLYGEAYKTSWSADAHKRVMSRTVRGLYFHHFGDILPSSVDIAIRVYREWPEELFKMSISMPQEIIGTNHLIYRYGRAAEKSVVSAWLFQFYNAHIVLALTDYEA